jgi:pimeloyl-ACP methyl ester carboxylesterase
MKKYFGCKRHMMAALGIALWLGALLVLGACDGSSSGCGQDSEYDTYRDGPFDTTQNLSAGPSGASGLFYPTELGRDSFKHPVFLWGCGGSSRPSNYADQMNRIASHGFVVIAEVSTIEGNGVVLKASLDWIINENSRRQSVFYQKLDTAKIALGGHSIGSVNAFAIAEDPRLTTTIHVAGGSLDGQGSGARRLTHPAAYICSENDTFGNVEKAQADYAVTTVPVFFTIMTGVDHINAAAQGLPATIAWLRWHLLSETERSKEFLSQTGEFCTGKFVSQNKNW